jgi:hypothetical protein
MRVCGQEFTPDILKRINQLVAVEPEISRGALSHHVCSWLDWRSSNGDLQVGSCRKALAKLNRTDQLNLPEITQRYSFQNERRKNPVDIDNNGVNVNIAEIQTSLAEFGEIEVLPVGSRYSKQWRIWKAMLDQYHYLGSPSLCGGQIRYIVKSSQYGYIGALALSSGTWALSARDKYIGWSENARISMYDGFRSHQQYR